MIFIILNQDCFTERDAVYFVRQMTTVTRSGKAIMFKSSLCCVERPLQDAFQKKLHDFLTPPMYGG